jgi:hypothetical protein
MTRDNSLELAQAEGTQTMTFVVEDSNLGGIAFTNWMAGIHDRDETGQSRCRSI